MQLSSLCRRKQLQKVLGADTLKGLADKAGITAEKMTDKLTHLLPNAVDKLTPTARRVETTRRRPGNSPVRRPLAWSEASHPSQ
ncbi:YidB family protein [Hyphomicrobium sp.]|uniref:YidB family protein n=1 Tax=Hyphomicrobium sp. TaxID=82 RepID=UPI001D7AE847|nr:YidB family protein [Hyphomicrobium sp.]MBY0558773.1 YidB family protein [Hyphomicrobium sp.]